MPINVPAPDDGSIATAITDEVIAAYQEMVDKWCGQGWWFTGYNLSKAVQEKYGKGIPRHSICTQLPHRVMADRLGSGEYNRTAVELQGQKAGAMPLLFHPFGAAIDEYTGAAGPAIMTPAAAVAAAAVPVAAPSPGPAPVAAPGPGPAPAAPGKGLSGDRLNVPASLCRAAGFNPGDTCYAYDDSGTAGSPTLTVTNTSRGSGELATYQVTSDGRIRITSAILALVGLNGKEFNMEGSAGQIVITAAK